MTRPIFLLVPCMAVLFATACGPLGSDTGTVGELGNGFFSYGCDGVSDPVCDDAEGPQQMPKGIAVGATFTASYTPAVISEDRGSAIVEPASTEQIANAAGLGSSFKAGKPGIAALLARRGTTVLDIIHVELADVDHIQLEVSDATGVPGSKMEALSLAPGQSKVVRALAVNPVDEMLAGSFDCAWSSEDETVAGVTTSGDNRVSLDARAVGTTIVRVQLGDKTGELTITVGDGSGGSGGAGGSSGSGGAGGGGTGGNLGGGGAGGGV